MASVSQQQQQASFSPSSQCMSQLDPGSYQHPWYSMASVPQQQQQQQQASSSCNDSRIHCQSISTSCSSARRYTPPPPPPPGSSFGGSSSYQSNSLSFPCTNSMMPNSSSSLAIAKEKTWPSNDEDVVRHLISLQKFDGLWNLSDSEVQNLSKKPLTSFQSNISDDLSILSTTIVILIFETKFDSSKTLWSFMVNKARKRLTELLGDNGKLELLINEIKSQL
ncbi:unnamed protein product [Adineta steineri]|nr:unnamed protein product [Adineta steineri]